MTCHVTAAQRSVSLPCATATSSMRNPQLTTMPLYTSRRCHCLGTGTWGFDGAVCGHVKPCSLVKGKAVPLQSWTGPEGSRKLRLPDFVTRAQDGGRLSALRTGRLYLQEILVVISVRG